MTCSSRSYPERLRRPLGASRTPFVEDTGQRDDVGRRVEVEGEGGQLLDGIGHAGLARGGDVAGAAALAEGRPDRSGRGQGEGVGAGSVAVGDDRDETFRKTRQEAVQLFRVEQWAVTRKEDDAIGAVGFGAGDPRQRRHHVAFVGGVGKHLRGCSPRRSPALSGRR